MSEDQGLIGLEFASLQYVIKNLRGRVSVLEKQSRQAALNFEAATSAQTMANLHKDAKEAQELRERRAAVDEQLESD